MTITGTVKKYFSSRGYGFITGEDDTDYFFHIHNTNLDHHSNYILEGQEVTFHPCTEVNGCVVRYHAKEVEFSDLWEIYNQGN